MVFIIKKKLFDCFISISISLSLLSGGLALREEGEGGYWGGGGGIVPSHPFPPVFELLAVTNTAP